MSHIDSSEIVRASVWLKPTGDALERIQKLMRSIHRHGGGPLVPPHDTLLACA